MYDQFGFYSENGFPGRTAGRRRRRSRQPAAWISAASIFPITARRQTGGGRQDEAPETGGGGFRDIFSSSSAARPSDSESQPGKGRRPRIRTEYRFLAGHQRHAGRAEYHALRDLRAPATARAQPAGRWQSARSATAPARSRQMAGAMKFNLTCPRCGGTGKLRNACPTCHGEGRIVTTGHGGSPHSRRACATARACGCRAKAMPARMGAPPGDLYITTRVEEHPFFHRDGDNIEIQVPVTVWEAGLGAKIEVPTIDGRALLKIPQGTQNGQKFRLREKGVFNPANQSARRPDCGSGDLTAPERAGRAHARAAAGAGATASGRSARRDVEQGREGPWRRRNPKRRT